MQQRKLALKPILSSLKGLLSDYRPKLNSHDSGEQILGRLNFFYFLNNRKIEMF